MKSIILLMTITFSFPVMAESAYVHKAKELINKMVEVKKKKEMIINDAEKLPPKERACEIKRALSYYKDNIVPLANELSSLRDSNFGKATPAEESQIDQEKAEKWNPIANDNRGMDKAAQEIDMSLCQ